MNDSIEEATGTPLPDPPLVEVLSEDPVLRHTKLIAEAWDCGPLTQVRRARHLGALVCWQGWVGRGWLRGSNVPSGCYV